MDTRTAMTSLLVLLAVSLLGAVSGVEITDPSEDSTSVAVGDTLILTCECDMGDDLLWYKDGMQQEESARIIINAATVSGTTVSLLTVEGIMESDAGRYECKSAEDPIFSTDQVTVAVTTGGQSENGAVSIEEPAGSSFKAMLGASFSLKCQTDTATDVAWYRGEDLLQDETGGFIINVADDASSNVRHSMLTKEDVAMEDAGVYRCVGGQGSEDSIQLTVAEPGDADAEGEPEGEDGEEKEGDGGGVLGMPSNAAPSTHRFNALWSLAVMVPVVLARRR